MRPIMLLAVLCLCAPAFAAPVPKELRNAPAIEDMLQGEWVTAPSQTSNRKIWKIEGRRLTVREPGSVVVAELVFHAQTHPMQMDMSVQGGVVRRGIVKVESERLYLKFASGDEPRPTDFEGCFVLTRPK